MSYRKAKADAAPAPVLICIAGLIVRVGHEKFTVPTGTRLRADHPAAKARPLNFIQDGATDAEVNRARQALVLAKDAANPIRDVPPKQWATPDGTRWFGRR